jgi:hypothetical protein
LATTAVGHRFAHGHDVGFKAASLESPEVRTGTAQSVLHFVSDDEAPRCAYSRAHRVRPRERRIENAAAGDGSVDEEGRRREASFSEYRNGAVGVLYRAAQFRRRHLVAGPQASRRRRERGDSGIPRPPRAERECGDGIRDSVVGRVHDQAAMVAGGHAGHAPRHVVGFTARIHEHTGVQMFRQTGRYLLGVVQNVFMQVTRMGCEYCRLLLNGGNHVRLGVTHMRHIVIHVEIGPALRVV